MSEAVIKLKVDGAGAAQRDVNSVSSALNSLGSAAKTSLVGLAAGLSAASFADYIKSAIDAADNLNDLSKSTAISVENLSGLQLAAKQSGSELESVAQAINKLSVNIGKDSERFAKLGITAKEPIEAFKQLSDIYKRIEDPQTRAAVAAEALGKSWQGTAPLLAEGSKSIGDMVEKGKRLSGVTQEMADEADKFNDSLEELKQKSSGLAIKLAGELLPAFNQILPAIKIAYEESGKLEAALVALGSVGAFLFTDEFSSETVKIKNLKEELNSLYADQKARADTFGFDGSLKRLLFGGYSTDELPKAIEYTKYQIQQLENQLKDKAKPKAPEDTPNGPPVDTKSFLRSGSGAPEKEKNDYDKLNKAIQARIATAQEELRLGRALSEAEKESANFKRGLAEGTIKLTSEEAKRYELSIKQLDVDLRKLEAEKLYQAAHDKSEGEIKSINDETLALEGQIEAYEKLPSLINDITVAKLKDKKDFLAGSGLDNVDKEISDINRKIAAYEKLKDVQLKKEDLDKNSEELKKARTELDNFLDPTKAQSFGDALVGSFERAGSALQKLGVGLEDLKRSEAEIARARELNEKFKTSDPKKYQEDLDKINERSSRAQIKNYANLAGAAKSFFNEGSKGYKTLEAAENAFRLVQIASDLQKGLSAAAVGIATQAQGDPYTAIPRMAAMAAVMAALGFAVGGFGGTSGQRGQTAAERQEEQGTGTVFGDLKEKSDSITKSIDNMNKNLDRLFPVNEGMLAALKNIESSIAGFAGLVVRNAGVIDGSNFGIKEGKQSASFGSSALVGGVAAAALTGGVLGLLDGGLISGVIAKLWGSTKTKIVDSGVQFGGKFTDLQAGKGFDQYASVDTTKSSFFGLKKKVSNSVQTQTLNDDLTSQFALIFRSLGTSLEEANKSLGGKAGDITSTLENFSLSTEKISLKGLKGADLTDAINSVISKSLDEVAKAAFPSFDKFREIGEGYAETVFRVANTFSSVNSIFEEIGLKLYDVGDAGLTASLGFAKLLGGLEEFQSITAKYYENFFTQEERNAQITKNLTSAFSQNGLGDLPKTREEYRALVEQISNIGTQDQLAAILKLSSAFAQVVPAALEEAGKSTDAFTRLLGTASKDIVKAQEDILSGINNAIGNAYNNQEQALRDVIKAREDEIKTIEDYRRTLFGGDNSPLSSIEKYQSAKDALSGANAGNVQDLVSKFLESAKIASASSSDYNASLSFANGILGKVQGGLSGDIQQSQSQLAGLPAAFRRLLDFARASQNGTTDAYVSSIFGTTPAIDTPTVAPLVTERVRSSQQTQDTDTKAMLEELKSLRVLTKQLVESNKLMADKADSNQPQLVEVVK